MTKLLDSIDGPADLKQLDEDQLQQVAQEVRELIIDTIGEIGGHFGANLGTCEIAVALHSLLDSPTDKVLWDVGHQAYPHKVLTGRRDQLHTIRTYGGLAPFCSIGESEHDIMGAGHASTSISYAVGIKEAMRSGIGDGRQGGRRDRRRRAHRRRLLRGAAERRRHGRADRDRLNDNGMSIAPNVGALSRYFTRMRLNPKLYHAREDVEEALTKLPAGIGKRIERIGPILKESLKAYWAPGLFFEELDLAYVGVIDGHDVKALREAIGEALEAERPVVVHVQDGQGQGLRAGRGGRPRGHGAVARRQARLDRQRRGGAEEEGQRRRSREGQAAVHDGLRQRARRRGRRDERVLGITAAMNSGTGLNILQRELPDRYYDVGIAEQHAVLFAAGLALQGAKPVAAIYSTFLQRGYDQIVHDVCLQKLDVVFAMDRAGLVGDDGPTHHGAFDISYLRCLPNIVLMAPRDEAALVDMLHTALAYDGPVALRYPRGEGEGVPLPATPAAARDRPRRAAARGRARRAARLRLRRAGRARRGRAAGRRARHRADRRRRPLRQAARRRAARAAGRRARRCW